MPSLDSLVNRIVAEKKRITLKEPEYVTALRKRTIQLTVYARGDTDVLGEIFFTFVKALHDGKASSDSLKIATATICEYYSQKFKIAYNFEPTSQIFSEAAQAFRKVKAKDKYLLLLSELWTYINLVHDWVDYLLPWKALVDMGLGWPESPKGGTP